LKIQPVIKWTGSKRSQSERIISYFPKNIETYYEPFVGGGSIVRQLLESDIQVDNYICSDINNDLINLWNFIKFNPKELSSCYHIMWKELNIDNDLDRKKNYFYSVRDRLNKLHKPEDFLFISRTVINGLIRYNKSSDFNASFHITRNGIEPDKMMNIIYDWYEILNKNNVQFICRNYNEIISKENDFYDDKSKLYILKN